MRRVVDTFLSGENAPSARVVSHLVPHDVHHATSRAWLTRHLREGGLVLAPALLLPEIAGAVARRTGAPRLAQRAGEAVLRLPALRLVPAVLAGRRARPARLEVADGALGDEIAELSAPSLPIGSASSCRSPRALATLVSGLDTRPYQEDGMSRCGVRCAITYDVATDGDLAWRAYRQRQ